MEPQQLYHLLWLCTYYGSTYQVGPQQLFDEGEVLGAATTDHFEIDAAALRAQV
jgi:hypothetical protein